MIALIITNIILAVVIGLVGVAVIVDMARNNRPIVIKEAKALREYYEGKFEDMEEKTKKAEQNYSEYKELYEEQLQRNMDMDGMRSRKDELEAQVERLAHELNSCEDRINDMAQENASLKEKLKALKEPAKKKPAKKMIKNEYRNNRRVD